MHPRQPTPRRRPRRRDERDERDKKRDEARDETRPAPRAAATATTTPPQLAREVFAGHLRPYLAPTRRSEPARPELRAFHERLAALADGAPPAPPDGARGLPVASLAGRRDSPR